MRDLKVTLVQANLVWEDRGANLAQFDHHLARLQEKTHLVVLPEMFSTGFSMNVAKLAEGMDGPTVQWLQSKAAQVGLDIIGSVIIEEDGRYFNRLLWARPDGQLFKYDKRHLFRMAGEEKVYSAGDTHLTVELQGWQIRPFVCYDLRFPVWTRNVGMAYDLAIFIANWPEKRAAHWRALLAARAIENQSFVVGVNRVGEDGNGHPYCGDSSVIDPLGNILFHNRNKACIQTVMLSSESPKAYRRSFPAWQDADTFTIREDEV